MKIHPIEAGNFKLDGGAMFGVVPKVLWQKTNPSDSNNMIEMGSRCMLIETSERLILIDAGMGDKQSEKFFKFYYKWGGFDLKKSINNAGFSCDEITDVFFTHLHFDHCGGGVIWDNSKALLKPLFKNAQYWSNKKHWEWAINPNPRERASFLEENLLPISSSGSLKFVPTHSSGFEYNEDLGFDILFVNGHTEKQMIPKVSYKGRSLVFAADLIPTVGHIPTPYIMGYDTKPLVSMSEKERFLKEAVDNNYYLFMEHDAHNEVITLKHTEKGVRLNKSYSFSELFS
ncbi:MAG: MBL fold metallo-hydrolase [Bacteroidetes bacterium]|jgi:glyoxylase-like metal-dependent hydrolase (beta-lactamase superfamily II)|nr:MAG: MBL fold metallo-hydrolase [Cryomorphaceae bacterium BACL29 MAG-121220-bin8]MDA0757396.1 MBL fold metallo-hydrolase [Bacteroidota bacterium]|tara:strand:+ start:43223 stop:44083 length:861 start_codon:yes stop_codon:yes gene_type:complete